MEEVLRQDEPVGSPGLVSGPHGQTLGGPLGALVDLVSFLKQSPHCPGGSATLKEHRASWGTQVAMNSYPTQKTQKSKVCHFTTVMAGTRLG